MSILLRGKKSLSQLARAILRSFGSDASSYPFATLAGAYQTLTGPAAVAVNDPVGFEFDAMGVVGPEVMVNPTFLSGGAGWLVASWALSTGAATATSVVEGNLVYQLGVATSGNVYRVNYTVDSVSAGGVAAYINGTQGTIRTAPGAYTETLQAAAANPFVGTITVGTTTAVISSFSCVQVTGNHATQTTAINRPTLQQDGGGRWYASFNGTNSGLVLSSVPFQMADDFAVAVCVKVTGASGWSTLFGITGATYTPRIHFYVDCSTGLPSLLLRDDANVAVGLVGSVDVRNTVAVLSFVKRGSYVSMRVNSASQFANTYAIPGVSTFTSAAIGVLGFDLMNGAIYDLDVIKGTVTDAQLLTLEKAAAQKAGLVL